MTDKKDTSLFENIDPEHLKFLDNKKTQVSYLSGENIFKQGAFAPYVIYVIDGLIKVFLQTGRDKQINLRLALPGDFLAFSSVFGEQVYTYSAIALKDSTICMIDREGLKQTLLKNPEFALKVTSRNFRNEKHLLEIIQNLSYKQMRGKLASILLYLSAEEFLEEEIFQYLTRQDIADFASISNESTIKFLKEFEKEGILKLEGKDVKIIESQKLEDISRKG